MIKKFLIAAAAVVCFATNAIAQNCPKAYIGVSTGLENPAGFLGFTVDVPIAPNFSLGSGLGLSTWGMKTYLEGRYYFKECHRGWAFGTGLSYNTGLTGFTTSLPDNNGNSYDVTLDLNPTVNAFVSGYHFFNLGRRHRFYLQSGYSVRLKEDNYTVYSTMPLSSDGKTVMKILQPGGFMFALGFSFGLGG